VLFEMKRYEEGFDYLERSRARAFLDMLAGRSVEAKKSVDSSLLGREREVQQKIDLATRRLRVARGPEREPLAESYRALLKERALVLESIKRQSFEYAATTTVTTVPARKIADRLGKGTAMISYFLGSKNGYIWVLKDGAVKALPLEETAEELGKKVSGYRYAITTQQEAVAAALGGKLSGSLIQPLLEMLSGIDRLYIVPSMALHHLPFSSLPLSDGRFLMQAYAVSVLPSGSSLFFLDKEISGDRESILALGNPLRDGSAPPLPFAEEEVRLISRNFSSNRISVGKDASESLIKEGRLAGTSIIHIAAHGKYNSAEPLKSALLLAGDEKNDGDLETFEIFSLRINPRLVVLSACESGLGKLEGGDEIQGLNRAFLYAGAGGVVSSLWSVSDQSTSRLMEHFYGLLPSNTAAEALRQAQIRLMKEYPAPLHWAPFYLVGGMEL